MRRATGVVVLFLVASGCGGAAKKDLEDIQNRVSALEANLKSFTEQQASIGEKIGHIDEHLGALKGDVANLIKEQLEGVGKRTEVRITILDRKVRDLETKIVQLQSDQGSIRSQVSGMAETLAALKADLGKLEADLQGRKAPGKVEEAPPKAPEKAGEK